MLSPSDERLIEEMRLGRGEALAALFDRHFRLVYSVAWKILRDRAEAEDLMQEVFLEIYRKSDLFDPSKGSAKVWILQYAYHRSLNRRKYLALRSFYDAYPASALADEDLAAPASGREGLTNGEWRQVLDQGMKSLSARERAVIESVHFDGLRLHEVADRARESYENTRNHYYRGLKKLRQILTEQRQSQRPMEVDDVGP